MTTIKDFTLQLSELGRYGSDLMRPESVIAQQDGTLFVSQGAGGVTRIAPDGTQETIGATGGEANGLALAHDGSIFIANIINNTVEKLSPDGRKTVILSELDGKPLGSVNYVFLDSQERLWIAVSTREPHWFPAAAAPRPDGYIILMDNAEHGGSARIVGDGIIFSNEARLDKDEQYLYVAETMARRISRFPVAADGTLGAREAVGPEDLGEGAFVDGFAFDSAGNIWVTTVLRNGLVIITPDGEAHTVFEDPNPAALEAAQAAVDAQTLTPEMMFACMGATLQFPTSVTFGGSDLKTVYMGSLAMPHLITFRSPVAGLPMHHWR